MAGWRIVFEQMLLRRCRLGDAPSPPVLGAAMGFLASPRCHSGQPKGETRNPRAAGAGGCASWVPVIRADALRLESQ